MSVEVNRLRFVLSSIFSSIASCLLFIPVPTYAQGQLEISYADAQQRFLSKSDSIEAAKANVRGLTLQEEATRSLRRPDLDIDTRVMDYQKTLVLPLGSLAPVASAFNIQDPLKFRQGGVRLRPVLSAQMPIYAGGKIRATQQGAKAQVAQATAELNIAAENGVMQLIQAYFSQQLAEQAYDIRTQVRNGLDRHLSDTSKLEREGFVSRAQLLQVQVARDEAEREMQQAQSDLATSNAYLSALLRTDSPVAPTTKLFVNSRISGSLDAFLEAARDAHPQLNRLDARGKLASSGVEMQKAKLRPTVYGFAQYDLYRDDALLTEPDWAFGIGVRYKIFGGLGRRQSVDAARQKVMQADAGMREARMQLEIGVTKAWNEMQSARQRFNLLDSSIASANENLRLQQLSYREGLGTSLDVIDAQLGLGRAKTQRSEAAFNYVMALAQLLNASGQTRRFPEYVARADQVLQ
ncbi:TolC family protein [Parasphingorhabdus sp. JC815]|uniref:TolC family protein n=1 Tax=Parasphingorhabdus sp. JC815 TaxID=3232140 RepID=UPI00345AA30D